MDTLGRHLTEHFAHPLSFSHSLYTTQLCVKVVRMPPAAACCCFLLQDDSNVDDDDNVSISGQMFRRSLSGLNSCCTLLPPVCVSVPAVCVCRKCIVLLSSGEGGREPVARLFVWQICGSTWLALSSLCFVDILGEYLLASSDLSAFAGCLASLCCRPLPLSLLASATLPALLACCLVCYLLLIPLCLSLLFFLLLPLPLSTFWLCSHLFCCCCCLCCCRLSGQFSSLEIV